MIVNVRLQTEFSLDAPDFRKRISSGCNLTPYNEIVRTIAHGFSGCSDPFLISARPA